MHTNYIQLPPDSTGKQLHVQRILIITVDTNSLLSKDDIITTNVSNNELRICEVVTLGSINMIHCMFTSVAAETLNDVALGEEIQINGVTKATVVSPAPYYQFFNMTSVVSADNPYNGQLVDASGAARIRFSDGQPQLTGYGDLKVSQSFALGVYEGSLDSYDALYTIGEEVGGTSAYSPDTSSTVLTTTATSGSRVVRTTNRYHYYIPGASNLVRASIACGDTGKAGNKRRWGLFDDNDGVFFELNEASGLRIVIRTSTFGGVTEIPVERATWNGDRLDGTGLSNEVLDVTKINNYWADYVWNGAGRVRVGVYAPDGQRLIAHTIYTANASPIPLVRSGTLPLRTENVNVGITASSSQLREICMSVHSSDDPKENYTFWRNSEHEEYGVTVTTDTHLMSMRAIALVNGKHNAVQVYPETLNVVVVGGSVAVTLWSDLIIPDATWTNRSNSLLQHANDGTVDFTGALKFKTIFFAEGAHTVDMTPFFELNDEGIMANADGTLPIWGFTATKLTGTTVTVGLNLGTRELW